MRLRRLALGFLAFLFCVWLNNTSVFVEEPPGKPKWLAHRGLAQTFEIDGLEWDTNTAAIIHEPEHPYIENTVPSIKAAFALGADMVEFDVRLTKDRRLVVFHDYLLEYRTNGEGRVAEKTLEELRALDVGHGYTADEGETFPFRGMGVGLMLPIEDMLDRFPEGRFLIHVKDGGTISGNLLANLLKEKDAAWRAGIGVYGDHEAMMVLQDAFPDLKVHSRKTLKKGLLSYLLTGWTGRVPQSLRGGQIQIPLIYAKFLWGWPDRFLQRMEAAGTRVILVDGNGKWSEGFDDILDLNDIPTGFRGYVWTNRIDRIAGAHRLLDEIDGHADPLPPPSPEH